VQCKPLQRLLSNDSSEKRPITIDSSGKRPITIHSEIYITIYSTFRICLLRSIPHYDFYITIHCTCRIPHYNSLHIPDLSLMIHSELVSKWSSECDDLIRFIHIPISIPITISSVRQCVAACGVALQCRQVQRLLSNESSEKRPITIHSSGKRPITIHSQFHITIRSTFRISLLLFIPHSLSHNDAFHIPNRSRNGDRNV